MDVQNEEIASTDAVLGPTTSKRSVKTQVVAHDQTTIVIGGLIQERTLRSVKKIPFLGSLPLLGWLFRDTVTTKSKTNLLVFLTPYIIRDESDYRRIYEKKRKEQQDFIEQFYGRQPRYEVDVDFARKAGPFARDARRRARGVLQARERRPRRPRRARHRPRRAARRPGRRAARARRRRSAARRPGAARRAPRRRRRGRRSIGSTSAGGAPPGGAPAPPSPPAPPPGSAARGAARPRRRPAAEAPPRRRRRARRAAQG